ncbi:MAG: calcium/sodium antiporter [Acidiferrobacterales bacterium]
MLLPVLGVVTGFTLLVWAADRFVIGAAATSRNLGVSPLIIGLTVVGIATSTPEILVSAMAAWQGNTGLSIGNALGSNIANIGLVLGVTAIIAPLKVRSNTLRREFPVLLAIMLVALVLMLDGHLGQTDAMLLLAAFGVVVYWITSLGLRSRKTDPIRTEFDAEIPKEMSMPRALTWLILGLLMLLISSRVLVWSAVSIAQALGVGDLVIGLTVIAIGTSLPELAAAVASALRNEPDIAVGTVIGSNMFNLLAVLGVAGLIQPGSFPEQVLARDFPVMIGLTLVLFATGYGFRVPGHINRIEGAALAACFVSYQGFLYYSASLVRG